MVDAIPSGAPFRPTRSGLRRIRAEDSDRDARGNRDSLWREREAKAEDSAGPVGARESGILATLESLNARLPDPQELRLALETDGGNPAIVLVERATGRVLGTSRLDELETLGLRLARECLLVDDHI